jgi:hypothetical protein
MKNARGASPFLSVPNNRQAIHPPLAMKCAFGALQPTAYAPGTVEGPVFDGLVTRCIRAGTQLSFRFYPQGETYLSQTATTVSFILVVDLAAGSLVRLIAASTSLSSMTLAGRARGASSWNAISATSLAVTVAGNSSLYVFMNGSLPITAIGLVISSVPPLFPAVLPPQYTVRAALANLDHYTYYIGETPIPENWSGAWRTMRSETDWVDGGAAPYGAAVDAAEDTLRIRIVPCQVVPIAFRPYLPDTGVWSLLVTSTIPAGTSFSIWANGWSEFLSAPSQAPCWSWNASSGDVAAGTVLTFTNLGLGNTPRASTGSIATDTGLIAGAVYALTAYFEATPITATYTTAYYDIIPAELTLGVSIRADLWPACASILVATACPQKRECNPTILSIQTNAIPLVRWLVQPIPSSYPICRTDCPYTARCCA